MWLYFHRFIIIKNNLFCQSYSFFRYIFSSLFPVKIHLLLLCWNAVVKNGKVSLFSKISWYCVCNTVNDNNIVDQKGSRPTMNAIHMHVAYNTVCVGLQLNSGEGKCKKKIDSCHHQEYGNCNLSLFSLDFCFLSFVSRGDPFCHLHRPPPPPPPYHILFPYSNFRVPVKQVKMLKSR